MPSFIRSLLEFIGLISAGIAGIILFCVWMFACGLSPIVTIAMFQKGESFLIAVALLTWIGSWALALVAIVRGIE